MAEVLAQYQKTVRPMHHEFVEPSKRMADVIIPTTSTVADELASPQIPTTDLESNRRHSMTTWRPIDTAIGMLKNHIESTCASCLANGER